MSGPAYAYTIRQILRTNNLEVSNARPKTNWVLIARLTTKGLILPWAYRRWHCAPAQRGPATSKARPSRCERLRTPEFHLGHEGEAHLLKSWASHLWKSSLVSVFLQCSHKQHFHPYYITLTYMKVNKNEWNFTALRIGLRRLYFLGLLRHCFIWIFSTLTYNFILFRVLLSRQKIWSKSLAQVL